MNSIALAQTGPSFDLAFTAGGLGVSCRAGLRFEKLTGRAMATLPSQTEDAHSFQPKTPPGRIQGESNNDIVQTIQQATVPQGLGERAYLIQDLWQ